MKTEVHLIPILHDNYVFVVCRDDEAVVIDPGEAKPVIEFLQQKDLHLKAVLITHHHPDHIGGLAELRQQFGMTVYAPKANREQISPVDFFVEDQQILKLLGLHFRVIATPGHTLGHVVYWEEEMLWLFSGDVVFGLGCGRLFEGSYEQAFSTLGKIKSLPDETNLFCTHEYSEANLRFCKTLKSPLRDLIPNDLLKKYEEQLRAVRQKNQPSVPLHLANEKSVNPFLLAKTLDQFAQLRKLRNEFR